MAPGDVTRRRRSASVAQEHPDVAIVSKARDLPSEVHALGNAPVPSKRSVGVNGSAEPLPSGSIENSARRPFTAEENVRRDPSGVHRAPLWSPSIGTRAAIPRGTS